MSDKPPYVWSRHVPDWKALLAKVKAAAPDWSETYVADGACGSLDDLEHFAHPSVVIAQLGTELGEKILAALADMKAGHTPLLVVGSPGVGTAITAVMVNEVTVTSAKQIPLLFGALQRAAFTAITHAIHVGVLPQERQTQQGLVILVQTYLDPKATNAERVYDNNVAAIAMALANAAVGGTTQEQAVAINGDKHPFCDVEPQALPALEEAV